MKIGVIGCGYVGLTASACLAEVGHEVFAFDSDPKKQALLQDDQLPFFEPGLDDLLQKNKKRIHFADDIERVIAEPSVIILAIGTPELVNGDADTRDLFHVARLVFSQAREEKTLVLKSTCPVGTGRTLSLMARELCQHPISVVSNPEFLRQGSAIEDFLHPDRIILGVKQAEDAAIVSKLYEPISQSSKAPILIMNHQEAELTKYAANSFLALKISFINELASLSEKIGADIEMVKKGFSSDQRINPSFFSPGIGFGGSCFPKDLKALIHLNETEGNEAALLKATLKVNEQQKNLFVQKVRSVLGDLNGLTLGVLGLSFKPNTDDIRRAPSIEIIKELLYLGARVQVYDPVAMESSKRVFSGETSITFCENPMGVARGASALLVLTEWPEFLAMDLKELKSLLKTPLIFDGRNLFDAQYMNQLGFRYHGVGK